MASVNTPVEQLKSEPRTHEGAIAYTIDAEKQLRRSILSCMLWENEFYEDGETIANRIQTLAERVEPHVVAALAVEARTEQHLRHAPLWLVRAMAGASVSHRALVRHTLPAVIQRADELTEFLALYWKAGRCPVSAGVKKGLAAAFLKFNEYQLAKYNRDTPVKLRDVLFLSHPKPKDAEQAAVWKRLVDGELKTPDTWETAISATKGEGKGKEWERLLDEQKLGVFALVRNLRNMIQEGVPDTKIRASLISADGRKMLPFRYLAAVEHAPRFAAELEHLMFKSLEEKPKLPGTTIVMVDVSGSMTWHLSDKSQMNRMQAATGLAVVCRELCEHSQIFTFSNSLMEVPAYRGLGLVDGILKSQQHGSTQLHAALTALRRHRILASRIIVVSDEQAHFDGYGRLPVMEGMKSYMINVASNQNGVGYGPWTHIDGWSDKCVDYIQALEEVQT